MSIYYVSGISGAVGGVADRSMGALWNPGNPSATKRITVLEVSSFYASGTGITSPYSVYLSRITARGSPSTTVTPTAANDAQGLHVPSSGAILDVTYLTTWPTLAAAPYLIVPQIYAASHGNGFLWPFPRGVVLLPGTGLAVVQANADTSSGHNTSFVWEE